MLSINQNKGLIQQQFSKFSQKNGSDGFFNILTNNDLFDKLEELLPKHRERTFLPTETLSMFLAQVVSSDSSCQKAVNDCAFKRLITGYKSISLATGGYCRARGRIPLEMISTLAKYSAKLIDNQVPNKWLFKGRHVKLIDGTTIAMPDTKANQASYPQSLSQKPGLGFPVSRVVGITSLSSGALLDASIGACKGKGTGEQSLLREMYSSFEKGDIILGDANFGTFFFLAYLQEQGIDAVFEQMGPRRNSGDFTQGIKLGYRDHIVELKKPNTRPHWMTKEEFRLSPKSIKIRELKVGGKLLITTFLKPKEMTKKQLKDFYKCRWHVELDIRNIKTTMGMTEFSCKSPKMIMKEMWVYFLAYNLIRMLMVQAAIHTNITPRDISFKHSLQFWLLWNQYYTSVDGVEMARKILVFISSRTVGKRCGRIEPRAVKRRHNNMPRLKQPRSIARQEIRQNGHPKKLK
ncbi:MAG: IS4 family transposase [Proteobacteria bacterium]|nr:IS4 family transposase [Pseudomonadota bacterium]